MSSFYQDPNDIGVGYKKPPELKRFKKGMSGNPKGRPKIDRANPITILAGILQERIAVEEGGKKKNISKMQALQKRLVNSALSGDMKALRLLQNLLPDVAKLLSRKENEIQEVIISFIKPEQRTEKDNLISCQNEALLASGLFNQGVQE